MRWVTHPLVVRAAQLVMGLIFIAAALAKIGNLDTFARSVHNFRLVPIAMENLVAISLPWIELVAGAALILGIRARAGALLVFAMMALFTVAVVAGLARGLNIHCGCFGEGDDSKLGLIKLFENLGMLALSWVALLRPRG